MKQYILIVDGCYSLSNETDHDAMTDYFDTAYYYGINVGQWDKPYELVKN